MIRVALPLLLATPAAAQCTGDSLTGIASVAHDGFGRVVGIDQVTAAVGAPNADALPLLATGAAHVFRWDGFAWNEEARLVASDAAGAQPGTFDFGDRFGDALDVSGDAIVVGAPGRDDFGQDSGAAYVFRRGPNGWTEEQRLVPPPC